MNIRNLVYYIRAMAPVVITGWTPIGIMAIFAPIWPTRFFHWLHHLLEAYQINAGFALLRLAYQIFPLASPYLLEAYQINAGFALLRLTYQIFHWLHHISWRPTRSMLASLSSACLLVSLPALQVSSACLQRL